MTQSLEILSSFKLRLPSLEVDGNAGIPFLMKQGNGPSSLDEEGKTGLFLSGGRTLSVSRMEKGMLGKFLSCTRCVKDPFEAQE